MYGKIVNYLTKKELQQVQSTFKIFDQDGSGSICVRQFDQILKSLGQNLRQEQLETLVQKIDKDGNGYVDFQEFLYLVAPKIIGNRSQKSYVEAFKILDFNGRGQLGITQLERANLITEAGLTNGQISQILEYIQQNLKRKFNLDTVLRILQRMPDNVDDQF